jgi:hypothetical protein
MQEFRVPKQCEFQHRRRPAGFAIVAAIIVLVYPSFA